MDACKITVFLALIFATATVTEAMKYIALPRNGRSGYLAFPRMGRRGYLAFPRMGRSFLGSGSDASKDGGDDCCLTGLKMEWVPQEGGTTTAQNVCQADSCCPGYREILAQKPDGVFYSMCIPSVGSSEEGISKTEEASRNVLQKLSELMQN